MTICMCPYATLTRGHEPGCELYRIDIEESRLARAFKAHQDWQPGQMFMGAIVNELVNAAVEAGWDGAQPDVIQWAREQLAAETEEQS